MVIFDYLFYRFYKFYFKNEKSSSGLITALSYLSFFQFLLVYCFIMFSNILLKNYFGTQPYNYSEKNSKTFLLIGVFIGLEVFNYIRYKNKNKVKTLEKQFNGKPYNKSIKIWMFFLGGVILFLLPVLMDIMITS